MTYLALLNQLTSQVGHIALDEADRKWRVILAEYGVLDNALHLAPTRMVAESKRPQHGRTMLETVAVQVLVESSKPLDFWGIREVVRQVLED